jgi:hypothetical protein
VRCEAATLEARAAALPIGQTPAQSAKASRDPAAIVPWVAGGALALLLAGVGLPRLLREITVRREARAIVGGKTATEIRAAIDARVNPALMNEASDRGDAYRTLRSMLDAAERERDIAVDGEQEIARRVREMLRV